MGTYYTDFCGHMSNKEFVASELRPAIAERGDDNIKFSVVGSVAYIACKGVGIDVWKLYRDGDSVGYKPMSEEAHPYYYDCPAHLFEFAGPTDNPNATEWRKACDNLRARRNAVRRLRDGDRIKLKLPLTFGVGRWRFTESEFVAETFDAYRRKPIRVWRCVSNNQLVRITKLESREFELLTATPA